MFRKILIMSFAVSMLHAQQGPEEILAKLSVRQKIGQLFVVAAASSFSQPTEQLASSMVKSPYNMDSAYVEDIIKKYEVGGVIFLYKSDPATQMALSKKFKTASRVPLLITQDCEWGLSMRLDSDPKKVVRYPRNLTLAAIEDEQIVYDVAYEIGKQCRAIGVHMNFAPVIDINNNKANPVIHDRSFGDDPQRVTQLAKLFVTGLHDAGILACVKHFPGHGDTDVDSHVALPVINHDRARLETIELTPFRALIEHGIDAIMHAHLHIPALDATGAPSSLSYAIVTQLLQEKLGYQGLNITDGLGMDAVMKHYAPGELELAAFLAGNDILLCPLDVPRAVALIEDAVKSGRVSEDDLNRRVLKLLRAKKWAIDQRNNVPDQTDAIEAFLTRPDAYAVQRTAYRSAITHISQHEPVSLSKSSFDASCIVRVGRLPEDVFIKKCEQYGRTVLRCSALMTCEELNACSAAAQKGDTIVIAIGEMNKNSTKNFGIAENTRTLVKQLHTMGKRVVVILFGTPYSIELFQEADVIIAAYEDAPVVQEAVVDVLRGDLVPRGRVPIHLEMAS